MNTIGIEHNLDRPRIKKRLVTGLFAYLWPDGMEWFHAKGMLFPGIIFALIHAALVGLACDIDSMRR